MSSVQADRSRLLNKHQQEQQAAKKAMKSKKGLLLEEAQKKFDELVARHEQELEEFDRESGIEKKSSAPTGGSTKAAAPTTSKKKAAPEISERKWGDLSKKELEEECGLRGLGKKGGKEDLITRLVLWTHENKQNNNNSAAAAQQETKSKSTTSSATKTAAAPKKTAAPTKQKVEEEEEDEEEEGGEKLKEKQTKPQAKKAESESESDDDDDDDDDDEDDDDEKPHNKHMTEEQLAEAERQYKREVLVQKAIRALLSAERYGKEGLEVKGFHQNQLADKLMEIKVKNFKPESLGYDSLEAFLKVQPENVLFYDAKKQWIFPARMRREK